MSLRVGLDARLVAQGLGISTVLVEIARRITSEVDLVWYGDPRWAPPGVADVRRIPGPFPLLDSPLGRAQARADGLDVMHFAGNCGWTRVSEIPTVLTVHDLIFMRSDGHRRRSRQVLGHRYMRYVVPRAARAATIVTAPSHASAREVSAQFVREVRVIPNGVDSSLLEVRGRGEDVLVFSGRDPRKGTINAIAAWRESGLPRRLTVLAGAGLPRGFRAAAGADLDSGRIQVHGYLPRDRLWQVLASGFALLHMSSDEGFGLPVLEAMAVGVPVIGGRSDAAIEVARDAMLLIDRGDPIHSAARALRRLEDDPEERSRLTRLGRDHARTRGWEHAASGYLEAYVDAARGG